MIPNIPTIKETGIEKKKSSPPRAASGLPHPGRSINIANIVTPAMPSRIADIFPKRIIKVSMELVSYSNSYCNILLYLANNQLQIKMYSTIVTMITTVETAKNLRRSKIVPKIPNKKPIGIVILIIHPTRMLIGWPHPGFSTIEMLALRAATINNVIAIFPKRIFVSSLNRV